MSSSNEAGHSHSHDSHAKQEEAHHDHEHSHLILHSHSHQHNELLGRGFLTNPAVRITWIGLLVNVTMAAAKAVGGVVFHSQALMADAIHSLSDMVADFLTLATVNVALKTGTFSKYPLGYGKLESVGTFLVSGVLLFAGVTVGWSSILQIFEYTLPTYIYDYVSVIQVHSHSHFDTHVSSEHSHSHGSEADAHVKTGPGVPNINAAWLALASIGIKELLYRKTLQVAHQTNSKVLVANAWHHRVDSLTAAVAFTTVISGVIFGVAWLDAVGGVLVLALIIHAGWGSFRDAWYELIDRGTPKLSENYQLLQRTVEEAVPSVYEVADVAVLSAGARTNIVVKLITDTNVTLEEMGAMEHDLVAEVRLKDRYVGKVFVEYELRK